MGRPRRPPHTIDSPAGSARRAVAYPAPVGAWSPSRLVSVAVRRGRPGGAAVRLARPGIRKPGAGPGFGCVAGPGYSPITLQIRPIMMKKPLNIAMRPMPPYGELAPS